MAIVAEVQIAPDEGEIWCRCPECDHVWHEERIPRIGGPELNDEVVTMALACPGCGRDIDVRAPLFRAVTA